MIFYIKILASSQLYRLPKQKLLITTFLKIQENLKDIANMSDSIGSYYK